MKNRSGAILPRWLIAVAAGTLLYMAVYLLRSDGLALTAQDGEVLSSVSAGAVFAAAALIALAAFACCGFASAARPEGRGCERRHERLFAALWLMLGAVYFLAQPVMSEPDAKTHYFRTVDVANGEWVSSKDENGDAGDDFALPAAWVDDGDSIRLSFHDAQDYADYTIGDEAVYYTYNNTAVYSPLSYLTQALGYRLALLFTDRLIPILNIMRLVNYLITGAVYLLAVRLMPYSKKYLIWAALMPMNLHEAMGIDTDAMVSALVALLLAACLYLRCDPAARLTRPVIALLYVTSFFVSQYKIVYVGACLLLFLIPPAKFRGSVSAPPSSGKTAPPPAGAGFPTPSAAPSADGSPAPSAAAGNAAPDGSARSRQSLSGWIRGNRRYLTHVVLLGALIVIASVGWLMIATQGLLGQYSDSHGQLMVVLHQPWIFIAALLRSILRRSGTYFSQMMGSYMGAFLVKNDMVLIYGVTIAIALISLAQYLRGKKERDHGLGLPGRLILLLAGAVTILLIFASEYILWTNYLGRYVDGIQGRYFLPVVPLFLAAVFGLQEDDMEKERPQYALLLGLDLCVALNAFVSWLYLTGSTIAY